MRLTFSCCVASSPVRHCLVFFCFLPFCSHMSSLQLPKHPQSVAFCSIKTPRGGTSRPFTKETRPHVDDMDPSFGIFFCSPHSFVLVVSSGPQSSGCLGEMRPAKLSVAGQVLCATLNTQSLPLWPYHENSTELQSYGLMADLASLRARGRKALVC